MILCYINKFENSPKTEKLGTLRYIKDPNRFAEQNKLKIVYSGYTFCIVRRGDRFITIHSCKGNNSADVTALWNRMAAIEAKYPKIA